MNKLERKDFLKICGGAAAGGAAGYVFSGAPFRGLQWLVEWTQNQHIPAGGKEEYLKTICSACRSGCEMSIRMIGERAVKIESSSNGCPIGQAALQLLYHPERISTPLKRISSKGKAKHSDFVKVSWDSALQDIAHKMNELTDNKKGHLIAGINKNNNTSSALLERLLKTAGSPNSYYEPALTSLANSTLGGYIDYDFLNTDFVFSFGARILEGWGNPFTMDRAFLEWKKKGVKIFHADAVCTRTASMADEWLNIKPGTEIILALGIANYLAKKKGKILGGAGSEWADVYKTYTLDKTAALTGLDRKRIEDAAEAFSRAKNPIAVAGRGGHAISSSSSEILAVYALNSMVGTRAVTLKKAKGLGELSLSAEANASLKEAKIAAGMDDFIKNKDFQMLFVNECDPVYSSTSGNILAEKMKKAFVISISPLLNDTAMYADYIFPSIIFLEENTKSANTLPAFGESKHAGDMFISLGKLLDKKGNFPWASYTDVAQSAFDAVRAGNDVFDTKTLKDQLTTLEKVLNDSGRYPLSLLPVEHNSVGDGSGMAFPYVLKTIDKNIFSKGSLYVQLNKITAEKYGLSEGDRIKITSRRGTLSGLRVHITGVVPPGAITIPLGFGHELYTKYAADKGVNPKRIMTDSADPVTGNADWWLTKVNI
jgi:menaquinone reductase, molybdopterin-binding-like subunit